MPFPTSSARAICALQVDSSQLHVASMQPEQLAQDKGHDEMCAMYDDQPRPRVYLKEGMYHTRLFRGPSTNDMKK